MTTIDHCFLGLIGHGESSGYDIRKVLTETPMRHYSNSPGAIYPALHRLESRKLIRAIPDTNSSRHRTSYRLTAKGRAVLMEWLRAPVTEAEIAGEFDGVMLRLSFQHLLGEGSSRLEAFLQSIALAADAHASHLRDYLRSSTTGYPADSRLALEAGLNTYVSLARWSERASRRIKSTVSNPRGNECVPHS